MNNTRLRIWDEEEKTMFSNINIRDAYSDHNGFCGWISNDCIINLEYKDEPLGYIYMWFTGLLDINYIGIYEGDFIKNGGLIGAVKYVGARFVISRGSAIFDLENTFPNRNEVIGNIYENPELLENIN